jgi:hypothetical protein
MTNISNPFVITCLHFPQKHTIFIVSQTKDILIFLRCYNIRNFVGSRMIKLVILNRFSFVIQPNIHI